MMNHNVENTLRIWGQNDNFTTEIPWVGPCYPLGSGELYKVAEKLKANSIFTKMATKIEKIATDIIKPSSSTPPNLKHHKLSFLDRNQYHSHIPLVLFYRRDSSDRSQICHQLKQSLSDALSKFYPLAGRPDEEGLFIDCNDSGALFVEAQVHAHLSQAIERTTSANIAQYLPTEPYDTIHDILLAVQINFFECGGIAIGACISHVVGDVSSLATFLNAWAATCGGRTETVQPNFDLGCHLFPPAHIPNSPPSQEIVEYFGRMRKKLVTKRFVFHKEKLQELKALAHEVKHPTRVEMVSAYIYWQFIEVNRAKVNPTRMFAFSYSVNLRPRTRQLVLPHNEFAFGNLSPPSMSALLTYEEVENFQDLLSAMRTVIRKFKDDQEASVQNQVVSSNDDMLALICNPEVLHFHFTSWCKFPFYEVDWGWGEPLVACTQALPAKNTVILMDTKGGEGMQALVTALDEDMSLLSNEFLSLENNYFSE